MLYVLPFISAAIGWVTNYIAVKMLFHPREERNFVLFKLHGIFPKRKAVLAERLGSVVARELISVPMLLEKVNNEKTQAEIKTIVQEYVDSHLIDAIKGSNPMLAMFATDEVIAPIKLKIAEELEKLIPILLEKVGSKMEDVNIEALVAEKVNNFSNEKLEEILMSVMKKEFKFIELAGAILGFLIGLIQVLLLEFAG